MILYTTMPQELIFSPDEDTYGKMKMIDHDGIPMLVMQEEESYYVVRLLSSDPQHFLDNRYHPGTKLSIH